MSRTLTTFRSLLPGAPKRAGLYRGCPIYYRIPHQRDIDILVPARAPGTALTRATAGAQAAGSFRRRRRRRIVSTALSVVLVAAIFGFALPHFASYRSVWASIQMMTWLQLMLVVVAAAASLVAGWVVICSVLPAIRLREAAAVNLGSTAVANTLPAGGALAMGISWAMLSGWGVSASDYVLYTLISGIWNVLARLGLPVLALLILVTAGRPQAGLLAAAAAGLALLVIVAVGFGLLLRSESCALRADAALERALAMAFRLARRAPASRPAGSLLVFRERARGLIAERGWRITAATAASNLALWLVLLASLRGLGLSQSQVPWQTSLAAFAFVRLVTVLPVTPGGAGITELGLVGILTASAGHHAAGQVTAAVLVYRAVTYLVPIPGGAIAYVGWRYAPWLSRGEGRPGAAGRPAGEGTLSAPAEGGVRSVTASAEAEGGILRWRR